MIITTTTDYRNPGFVKFIDSADKHKWDYTICSDYKQFGSKQKNAYMFLKKNPDIEHIFILDSWDVLLLGTEEQCLEKIQSAYGTLDIVLFNAEKGCWPYPEWKDKYPETTSKWRFLNGGVAFVNSKRFIEMYESHPIGHQDNDQLELQKIFFEKRDRFNFQLDTGCHIFQSVAFEEEGEFLDCYIDGDKNYEVYFVNKTNDTNPLILHGNGHTDMTKLYKIYG